jgi:hypothetical protein
MNALWAVVTKDNKSRHGVVVGSWQSAVGSRQ